VWRRRIRTVPGDLSWRAGVLFMVGASCFAAGSIPLFFLNVSARLVGTIFFVGSIFFTGAGLTQLQQEVREGKGGSLLTMSLTRWAVVVQLMGMLFFNVSTFRAAFGSVAVDEVNRLVWAPDFFGSVAFLIASHLSWWAVCGRLWCARRESADWWMAALNYLGSIFFMLAAIGAFTLAGSGDMIDVAWVNAGTFLGAACFFAGAYLLLPAKADPGSVRHS
jgi:hypothetical protein